MNEKAFFKVGRSFRAHQNYSWNRKSTSAQASATQSGRAVRRILKTVMAPNRTLVMDKPRIIESTVARIWKFSTTAPLLGLRSRLPRASHRSLPNPD